MQKYDSFIFDAHIKLVSRTAFFHLRNLAKIRNILSQSDAEKSASLLLQDLTTVILYYWTVPHIL